MDIFIYIFLQSFTNEDQLTVHKKKHDMSLNLGNNSKNGFVGKTCVTIRFTHNTSTVVC